MSHIIESYKNANVPVFEIELNEREAFKAMFSFRQPLAHLDPAEVSNVNKAIANAEAFAAEVIALLRKNAQLVQKADRQQGVA
eukprot:scaffold31.g3792.t1